MMELSKSQIIGSYYRFTRVEVLSNAHGNRTNTVVAKVGIEYEFKNQRYETSLWMSSSFEAGKETFGIAPLYSPGGTEMTSIVDTKKQTACIQHIEFDEEFRGIGLVYVLGNISLYHILRTRGINPKDVFVSNVIGGDIATFGALYIVLKYGFSVMPEWRMNNFFSFFDSRTDPSDCKIIQLNGKRGTSIPVLSIGVEKIIFWPQIPLEEMTKIGSDYQAIKAYLLSKRAFLARADYYLSHDAIIIMPDYVGNLPENPDVF